MIRAVLDTNIVIRALLAKRPSPPVVIYQAFISQRFILVTSARKADYIVSGDRKHLLNIGRFQGIPIITAQQFVSEVLDVDK